MAETIELSLEGQDKEMFARVVRMLLEGKRIMQEKDDKLYSYISAESNRKRVSDYLSMADISLVVDRNTKVCFAAPANDVDGLKTRNHIDLNVREYLILLVLWRKYIDNCGLVNEVYISKEEIADEVGRYNVPFLQGGINPSLKKLKRYDLIDYTENDDSEQIPVRIYPSVQFAIDWDQFVSIAEEYIETAAKEDKKILQKKEKEEEDF